ncbi:hypothetical protein M3685_12685 [Heyndrickxia oleronia]|uniref:hypothetical protein n=1 Tax=Heyndrickxia oleronia TaxID=38875 RepID=UPI00203E3649|nr:hypothetical protein [Heyndrickxia oleronia]MCM3454778.1 hypothetical protein [Heyndrickxia oleronia]
MEDLLEMLEYIQPKTEEEINEHFEILKQLAKKRGNYYGMSKDSLPDELIPYLLDFEERQWIKFYGDDRRGITIPDYLRDWHTPEEAVEHVIEEMEEAYLTGDYQKALGSRWHPNFNFPSNELANEYYRLKSQAFDIYAQKLVSEQKALDYFMNNESIRGTRMNRFSEQLEKDVVKVASEEIRLITDFNDMKDYFDTHAFFCGISKHSYRPEIKVVTATRLVLAALCEATESKDIAYILSYTGGSWTGLNSKYKIVYPSNWDFNRVFDEMSTPEAMAVIESEMQRLQRLNTHKRS